ncbi:MAG: hypothetical protein O3A00_17370 [Planctomycetota bacterium]|nr:hypothetical protein [Planctomycetota bacterium]
MRFRLLLTVAAFSCCIPTLADDNRPDRRTHPRFEFTTMVAHWANYGDPGYLSFIKDASPDVAQIGFYGAHFWSLVHTPQYKGYPAHFPKQGHAECGKWFADLNQQLHKHGVKTVGHMNVSFLVGDPDGKDGPRGFFKFYRDLWDEKLLGPKPVENPLDLLEKDINGKPISNNSYSIGGMREYWACLRNPKWRAVLKAWTKHGIQQGLDGFMINYFYRHDCHCEHCVSGFKRHLSERYSADELRTQFKIADLKSHRFPEIVAWHNPAESTLLRREMLRFSQISNKQAFDDVFVDYGRSLKPDLIVAQWNHLGRFSQINGNERCLLPVDLWGRNEDYAWYSTGSAAFFTDLEAGILGEGTLQARYIRGAFDDKPFTLGKYESTRTRVAIAELAANGGAPMGFYTRFTNPEARQEIVRYYSFIKRHARLFKACRPLADVVLIYPRSRVHGGDVAPVEAFKKVGDDLLNQHILFDVIPDDLLSAESKTARSWHGRTLIDATDAKSLPLIPKDRSRFELPRTVRVSMNQSADGKSRTVHLVNYNRIEPAQKRSAGGGIKDEKPIAVESARVDLKLAAGQTVTRVRFLTPEVSESKPLKFTQTGERLMFDVPQFLVYAVIVIE